MIRYRSFRNTDPPAITAIWRSRSGQRGLTLPVSPDLFEQLVFGKLYFDYEGLILAFDEDRPVGFAHAAFGPDESEDRVSTELGVTGLVLVHPDYEQTEVSAELLGRCEEYLLRRGAKVLYGGGIKPLNAFYLGLYGGSELPGVLESDALARELFQTHNYREIDRTVILQRNLSGFQAIIDRRQMQIRRRMIVEVTEDPPTRTWWEAGTLGPFDMTRFELIPRGGGRVAASATFRGMDPVGMAGVGRAAGLIDIQVEQPRRRKGLATFVLSEAFRQFIRQGVMVVEAQVMQQNTTALGMYHKFGFRQVGQGSVFRKNGGA